MWNNPYYLKFFQLPSMKERERLQGSRAILTLQRLAKQEKWVQNRDRQQYLQLACILQEKENRGEPEIYQV
jgi:hypothetical protein